MLSIVKHCVDFPTPKLEARCEVIGSIHTVVRVSFFTRSQFSFYSNILVLCLISKFICEFILQNCDTVRYIISDNLTSPIYANESYHLNCQNITSLFLVSSVVSYTIFIVRLSCCHQQLCQLFDTGC